MHKVKIRAALLTIVTLPFSAAAAGLLEEIVVTAQKREQNVQDVGIAITAFGGDQIESMGWHNAEDVGAQTPGLISLSYNGNSTTSFFVVRGVGQADFADHHEAPTVTYRDGAYIPNMSAQGVHFFDIERVEVLKGPQGTLFGRNATGGLVHVLSRRPTEEVEAYGEVEISEYDSARFEGAVSGPLMGNLQGRLSFVKNDADGYVDNSIGPDLYEKDDMALRAQLQAQVGGRLDGHVSFNYSNQDDLSGISYKPVLLPGGPGVHYSGFIPDTDPFKASVGGDNYQDKEAYQLTGTFGFDVADNIRLTSITDYQKNRSSYKENTGGEPTLQYSFASDQDVRTFAQELRLNSSMDRLNWTAGLYYLDIEGDYSIGFDINDFPPLANIAILGQIEFPLETESWAVFGQLDYQLTESLTVTAGLRYTEDRKDFDLTASCASGPNPTTGVANPVIPDFFGPPLAGLGGCDVFGITSGVLGPQGTPTIADAGRTTLDRKDEDFTAKIQLDWHVNDDTLVYAGFNRGMKAGGYTPDASASGFVEDLEYGKEVLHAYEVGLKTDLFNGRARLNTAGFYYDYRDYQAFFLVVTTNLVSNHDAEVYGGEIELFVEPADGWTLGFGLSLLDATVKDISGVGDQDMILAPDATANFLVRKEWWLDNDRGFALQFDGVYVDDHTANSVNSPGSAVDNYALLNGRVSYWHNSNWELSLFVRNLTDEEYWKYAFDTSHLVADSHTIRAYAPPRWVGGTVRYTWK